MKTSVNMIRNMGNFNVTQRTKDSFFNATELLKQWNKHSGQKKVIAHFFENANTSKFIEALKIDIGIPMSDDNQIFIKARGGKNQGTWMTPILFIKFAMWLNPHFEVKVIKFVYDNLIAFRNNAGDNYIELSNSVQRLNNCDFRQMAKGLNWIVFNRHKRDIRQEATQDQLMELNDIQKKLAFAVDMGYIRSFDELINEMRRMWSIKWNRRLS